MEGFTHENEETDERLINTEQETETEAEAEAEIDLLIQQNDREDKVIQFLQALDLQVIGACRADERLVPLLKTNVSNCAAEDRFLANLIQHFEAQEIGMMARCLCMPLVSMRVGRVVKQGNLLCPTAARGNLNLTLLPSSNLRISFIGDDGCSERLATLSSNCEHSGGMIEEIPTDASGRSFLLKLPNSQVYFWSSVKSKLIGNELLAKMRNVLERKPSLAELTGISESRLDCFSVHFGEYLHGSTAAYNTRANQRVFLPFTDTASDPSESDSSVQMSSSLSNLPFSNQSNKQTLGAHSHSVIEDFEFSSVPMVGVSTISVTCNSESSEGSISSSSSLGFSESSLNQLLQGLPSIDPTRGSNIFSPYYCLCPPSPTTLHYPDIPSATHFSNGDQIPLPPMTSLLSANRSLNPSLMLKPSHSLIDATPIDLLGFLSDPVVHLPLSISFAQASSSQQLPTFTPLMCDPIVHIPAFGVCSSGQGYLVSAGHAVSTAIPLHPHIISPSILGSESVMEKGARETLQLLLGSAHSNPWSRDVPPAFLTSEAESEVDMLDSGHHNQFCETSEFDSLANSIGSMGFVSLPHGAVCDIKRRNGGDFDSGGQSEKSGGLQDFRSDDVNNDTLG